MQASEIAQQLAPLSTPVLTALLKRVCGGSIGFDPRRDVRTNKKPALIEWTAAKIEIADWTYSELSHWISRESAEQRNAKDDDLLQLIAEPAPTPTPAPTQARTPTQQEEPAPMKQTKEAAPDKAQDASQKLAQTIADVIKAATRQDQPLDVDAVRKIAGEVCAAALQGFVAPLRVEIKTPNGQVQKIDGVHKRFPALLAACAARCNVWLHGPAGSGKTTAAEQVGAALSLACYSTGAVDGKHEIVGYMDAMGRAVVTAFKIAYMNGGVYLFDEADASHPAALLAVNNALANNHYTFPGDVEPTARHPDFICIVGANTRGSGADANYNARNRMDVSTRDRFVYIDWPQDDAIEAASTPRADWLARVRAARAWIEGRKIAGAVVTARASIYGSRLLDNGMTLEDTDAATWGHDLTAEQIKECTRSLPALKKAA